MEYQGIYNKAIAFLLSHDNINQEDIDKHLDIEILRPKEDKGIYIRLVDLILKKSQSQKIIKDSLNIPFLSKILFDFNPKEVAQEYTKDDSLKLLNVIIREHHNLEPITGTAQNYWLDVCKSLIDIAYFLLAYKPLPELYKMADFFANTEKARDQFPSTITLRITGFTYPMACHFLRSIGLIQYGPPNIYIKDIFKELKLITSEENLDIEIHKIIDEMAKENNVSHYAVAKLFWLVGTGDFHLSGKKIKIQTTMLLKNQEHSF